MDTSDSKGLQEIASKMGLLNQSTKSLGSQMRNLTTAFNGWIAFLGVREITKFSDEMQNLQARLKINAAAGEDTAQTFQQIADVADRTNRSIKDVGDVYTRFAGTLKSVGANASEISTLTETLINTFRASGSGTQETANAMIQLSQAFSAGVLRGQDLRSVISQNVVFARYLREAYGKDLFKKAEAGAIKISEVVRILNKNQNQLAKDVANLKPTFEEVFVKATNRASIAIGELNEKYGLSAKFATLMTFALDNFTTALKVMVPILVAIAVTYIPDIIAGVRALSVALTTMTKFNVILLILTGIAIAGVLIYDNWDKVLVLFKKFQIVMNEIGIYLAEAIIPYLEKIATFVGLDPKIFSSGFKTDVKAAKETIAQLRKDITGLEKDAEKRKKEKGGLDTLGLKAKGLDANDKGKKLKEILGDLNKELDSGKISLEEYNTKLINFDLAKLKREFEEGKFDIFTFNQKLKELNIQEFNRQLKVGVLTFSEYKESVRQANLDELNAKFEAGRISLIEYNQELLKLSDKFRPGSALIVGVNSYIESIGTLSENIAKGITSTFNHLEDNLVEFVKTGEFNFAKFTQAVLDDLTRIIIRASIMKPLAEAILNGFSAGSGTGTVGAGATDSGANFSNVSAHGNAFYNGMLKKFASGGIVNSPTAFTYGNGKRGLMGEAGSEAILPLRRGSNGDLGVVGSLSPVTVNIINTNGSDVQQRETTGPNGEKSIEILITNKVREGILTGKYDSALKGSYGLNRKGS